MRKLIWPCLLLVISVGPAWAAEKKSVCKKRAEAKAAASKTPVAKTSVAKTTSNAETTKDDPPKNQSGKKIPKPVPDPVPQSLQSQVKFLASGLGDLPPNPQPGECYVRVKQTAQYEVVKEKVLVQEASVRYETTPAKFKEVQQKVLVRPETVRYEIIPEKWEKKTVEVETLPEHQKLQAKPAEFKTEDAQFEVLAERVYWKRGAAPLSEDQNMTDDILCLVREKPQYKDYKKKLVKRPAKLSEDKVDKKTQKVETQVLVRASKVKEIKVPAEYTTVMTKELVEPAKKKKIEVPAKYMEVERQVLLEQERMVWQRVLCDTNVTKEVVENVQTKLKKNGFDPGPVNGQLTAKTCEAVKKYQKTNKLSEGPLTYEFLHHIGVDP